MKFFAVTLTILILLFSSDSVFGQTQAEKDRAAFISNSKLLERDPFNPNAPDARSWGFKWLVETDQVSVTLCSEMMKLVPEKKNKFKGELLMQLNFGTAVFKLENPDKKNDEAAATLAGLESMLRTYEKMLSENPKAKNADLDALVAKMKAGELKPVADAAACKK